MVGALRAARRGQFNRGVNDEGPSRRLEAADDRKRGRVSGIPNKCGNDATGPGSRAVHAREGRGARGGTVSFDWAPHGGERRGASVGSPAAPRLRRGRTGYDGASIGKLASEFTVEAAPAICVVRWFRICSRARATGTRSSTTCRRVGTTTSESAAVSRHFPGQRCSTVMVTGHAPGSPTESYAALLRALGVGTLSIAKRWRADLRAEARRSCRARVARAPGSASEPRRELR